MEGHFYAWLKSGVVYCEVRLVNIFSLWRLYCLVTQFRIDLLIQVCSYSICSTKRDLLVSRFVLDEPVVSRSAHANSGKLDLDS